MPRWTCPYCNCPQVYTEKNSGTSQGKIWLGSASDSLFSNSAAILCLNEDCSKTSLYQTIYTYNSASVHTDIGEFIATWRLWPESSSKPQPDYIPSALRNDYSEACAIKDKSPKASATLARRCLQGMIRDFCGIVKGSLAKEIEGLRQRVEDGTAPPGVSIESVEGIDAVRSIGNIGAHMEKDINLIVDVDPGEAQALIELIETLFDEWYIARHVRAERFAKVAAIAAEKKALIAEGKTVVQPPPS